MTSALYFFIGYSHEMSVLRLRRRENALNSRLLIMPCHVACFVNEPRLLAWASFDQVQQSRSTPVFSTEPRRRRADRAQHVMAVAGKCPTHKSASLPHG